MNGIRVAFIKKKKCNIFKLGSDPPLFCGKCNKIKKNKKGF